MINYNFKLLWVSKLISQLGDKFFSIALAWWILQETDSTVSMGFFLFASVVPGIIFGFFTGALCDRWNRKRIMVITDAIRGILVLTISILAYLDILMVWQVFVIGICLSIMAAFFDPSSQAILPDIVVKEDLKKANSMCQMVSGLCSTLGPMLGALIVSFFGTGMVFLLNSISFFAAVLLTGMMRYKPMYRSSEKVRSTIMSDIREGLYFIRKRNHMVAVLVVIGAAHFFVGSLSVSLPFLANSLTGKGVNNLGSLEMLMGIGLLSGAAFRRLTKNVTATEKGSPSVSGLMKLMLCYGVCFLFLSAAGFFHMSSVALYLPSMFLIGVIMANASIFWQLLLQINTPSEMMGRVCGIASLIGNASLPIAYGIIGIVLNYCGIASVMLFSGVSLMILSIIFMKGQSRSDLSTV